jgi:tetrahydrodipicolinate N-succinyltransferase
MVGVWVGADVSVAEGSEVEPGMWVGLGVLVGRGVKVADGDAPAI